MFPVKGAPLSSNNKARLAVLASGNGTNLEAIIRAAENPAYPAVVSVVLSDQRDCFALARTRKAGIPAVFIDPSLFPTKEAYDQMLVTTIKEYKIDLVILAGFMRILSPLFVRSFPNQILNIHPSLLPDLPGLNAVKKALDLHLPKTGCTIHYVDEGVDTGPLILQEEIPIHPDDTEESLHNRIHTVEHRLYPQAIKLVLSKRQKV